MSYLDYETQAQKREDGSYLIKHKETGEPIAIVNKGYGKKVTGEWHPDFKLTHPEINDNILHSNMNSGQSESAYNRNSFDSLDSAKHRIGFLAKQFKTGKYTKDPVKVQYRGEEKEADKTKHLYDMLDDEGQKFGTLKTEHSPKDVHAGSRVDATWDDEYRKNTNISDTTKEAALKKHGGSDLESVLYRARYLLDNKDKEPRFVGTQQSDSAKTNVFKTKLKPEEASSAYEEALRKTKGDKYEFTRHSPTAFTMHKPANSEYESSEHHTVTSFPGELHHTEYRMSHPDYRGARKNNSIVESV